VPGSKYRIVDLVTSVRDALAAVAPIVERVGIRSHFPDAYDEWDAIAAQIFNSVMSWENIENVEAYAPLAPYGLPRKSYAGLSFIGVSQGGQRFDRTAFVQISSEGDFDGIDCELLNDSMEVIGRVRLAPFAELEFSLCLNLAGSISIEERANYH
jgi:hypothetical protein